MGFVGLEQRQIRWFKNNQFVFLCFILGGLLFFAPSFEGSIHATFILVMWIIAFLSWFGLTTATLQKQNHFLFWPLLAFVAIGSASTFVSANLAASINWFSRDLALILLFAVAFLSANKITQVTRGLKIILVFSLMMALYGIYQTFFGLEDTYHVLAQSSLPNHPLTETVKSILKFKRAFSFFAYPNLFGGFLVLIIPVNLFAFHQTAGKAKWMWLVLLFVHIIALVCTKSFGSWGAAASAAMIFYLLYPHNLGRNKILIVSVLSISVAGLLWLISERSLEALGQSFNGRLSNWQVSLLMIKSNWLLGIGPGRFGQVMSQLQDAEAHYMRFAHQFLLQQLIEKGVLGLLAIVWLIKVMVHSVIKYRKATSNNKYSLLINTLIASLVGSLIHASVDLDADYLKTAMFIWLFAGLLMRLITNNHYSKDIVRPAWSINLKSVTVLALIGVLVMLMWKGGKSLVAEGSVLTVLSMLIGLSLIALNYFKTDIRFYWKRLPLNYTFLGLVCWAMVSVVFANDAWLSVTSLWLFMAGLLVYCYVIYLKELDKPLIGFISLAPVVLAGLTVIEWMQHFGGRVDGGWPTSNMTAAFLAMGLITNITIALFGQANKWMKRRSLLASILIFIALLCTGSFAGFLNSLSGISIIGFWGIKRRLLKKELVIVSVIAVIGFTLIMPFGTGKRIKAYNQYHGQTYERLGMIKSTLSMIRDNGISGIGPGHFGQVFEKYKFPNIRGLAQYGNIAHFAHNELLQVAVILGLPAFLIIIWIIIVTIRRFRHFLKQLLSPADGLVELIGWAVLTGAVLQGLVDFNWHLPILFILYMMIFGMIMRFNTDVSKVTQPVYYLPFKTSIPQILMITLVLSTAVLLIRPVIATYYINTGEAHYYKKQLKLSSIAFERALSLTPLSATAYDKLGRVRHDLYAVYREKHWFNLAQWAFSKAIKLNSGDAYYHRHLGQLYHQRAMQDQVGIQKKWFARAEFEYRQAILKSPKNALLYFELGNVLRDAKRLESAKATWEKALEIEPNYAAAASNLGVACELLGLEKEAEKAYRHAINVKQFKNELENKLEIELFSLNWTIVHYNLGALLERQGRLDEAIIEYESAIEFEPGNILAIEQIKKLEKNK